MKFTSLALSVATACILSLSAINPVAADDYVVADRNMPQKTDVVDLGIGIFFKRDASVEAPQHKKATIKRQNLKNKRAATAVAATMDGNVSLRKRGAQNSGKGTFFSPNRGSCGWENTSDDLIVAVNEADMGNKKKSGKNVNCGRLVEIVNAAGKKVRAKVADTVSV